MWKGLNIFKNKKIFSAKVLDVMGYLGGGGGGSAWSLFQCIYIYF